MVAEPQQTSQREPRKGRTGRGHRRWLIPLGLLLGIVLVLVLVRVLFLDAWVRDKIETELNTSLDGYTVELAEVDLSLLGPAAVLHDLVLTQDAHPEPPVAEVPKIRWSMQWGPLLQGHLRTKLVFDQPAVYLNLEQLREMTDDAPDDDPVWQEVLKTADFLEFNRIEIQGGALVYADSTLEQPLHAQEVNFVAEDIRMARSEGGLFPSPFEFEARIFDEGHLRAEGDADFLAIPLPAVSGRFEITNQPLNPLHPIVRRFGVRVSDGVLNTSGTVTYGAETDRLHIQTFDLSNLSLDYRLEKTPQDTPPATDSGANGAEAVQEVAEGPRPSQLQLRIERATVDGDFGVINPNAEPAYRVFLQNATLDLTNYSNRFMQGPAEVDLTGLFMGSGRLQAGGTFRPEQAGPDFDLALQIEDTHLPNMNRLLEAYGNFKVKDGSFSFYSEFAVQNGYIEGYLRPLFGEIEVSQSEEDDGVLERVYDTAVGAISSLLENVPRDEVATEARFSGPLDDPDMSTWEVIMGLLQNAFFDAILPGFESEI